MMTNKSFFQGEMVSTHMGAEHNPDHKRNKDLISVLDTVYVVSYEAPRELRESHSSFISESREMGACCFMLPCNDPLLRGLPYALLEDEQLSTGFLQTCRCDPSCSSVSRGSPEDNRGELRSRSRTTLLESKPWFTPKPFYARDVHDELEWMAQDVEAFKCKAMSDAKPTIFWVRARELEVDVLEHLSLIISKEVERCDPWHGYLRIGLR
jgi:hypothetical protein